jgi:hypothetical protein
LFFVNKYAIVTTQPQTTAGVKSIIKNIIILV